MEKLTYKQALLLGFKRDDLTHDNIFFDQNGFKYFIVSIKLGKRYAMDWDIETHNVTLYKNEKTFKKDLTIKQVKEYINLLK